MKKQSYILHLQYLGFRYSGWQKQPAVKTIQLMLDKTIATVLGHNNFKTLAAGRTDAKVSATKSLCEVFFNDSISPGEFKQKLNTNLPPDIKVIECTISQENVNIIQDIEQKTYCYFFSYGEKFHPFCAPYMTYIEEPLDIELMQEAASHYIGEHNFINFCYKSESCPSKNFQRTILSSEIKNNDLMSASFFPKSSYYFKVQGTGFMRYQVRMMVGLLFKLGRNKISLSQFQTIIAGDKLAEQNYIAPASGLILKDTILTN